MDKTTYSEDYLLYQTERNWLRKTIRKVYLWSVRRFVIGKAIDFGCGVGEHLQTFPPGSIGLEINQATVDYCKAHNLPVNHYNPDEDHYQLKTLEVGKYETLVISHVLEHLEQPDMILKKLMVGCERIGVRRIVVVVPCEKGFAHDKTHITFINKEFVQAKGLINTEYFKLSNRGYFPFNIKWVGKFFVYNEMFLVYDRA